MSATNLLWLGLKGTELFGSPHEKQQAKELLTEIFNGAFEVNVGSSIDAYYGGHATHTFGADSTLVFSSSLLKTAGLLSKSYSSSAGGGGLLTGMNGLSHFNYGARTGVTYGGPANTICRGISMSKLSNRSLPTLLGLALADEQAAIDPPWDTSGAEIVAEDTALVPVLSLLSTLLYLVTAGAELAIRFAYTNYPKTSSTAAEILAMLDKEVVPRIMGLIYSLDAAGSWSNWLTAYKDYVTRQLAWCSTPAARYVYATGIMALTLAGAIAATIEEASA